jgi:hypothetical protein
MEYYNMLGAMQYVNVRNWSAINPVAHEPDRRISRPQQIKIEALKKKNIIKL